MTTLENLWYGNIRPVESYVDGNTEYRSLLRIVTKNREKFEETFAPEQAELFEKYYAAVNEMNAASEIAAFKYGFALAVGLLTETAK